MQCVPLGSYGGSAEFSLPLDVLVLCCHHKGVVLESFKLHAKHSKLRWIVSSAWWGEFCLTLLFCVPPPCAAESHPTLWSRFWGCMDNCWGGQAGSQWCNCILIRKCRDFKIKEIQPGEWAWKQFLPAPPRQTTVNILLNQYILQILFACLNQ